MTKDLRTFLDDMKREYPREVVAIGKSVDPAHYDVTAIVKHLGAEKKCPLLVFERPVNCRGELTGVKLVTICENTQKKVQVALGVPRERNRMEMARECLRREAARIPPVIIDRSAAPVKEKIQTGEEVDLYDLPLMRHHEMDGGPYIDMPSVSCDGDSRVYNLSYHRMKVKDRNHTGFPADSTTYWT